MDRGRQLLEDRGVVAHQPKERRAPRTQRDDIDQDERPHRPAVHQMRAQRHGTADVVGDDRGAVETPEVEKIGQPARVSRQRDVLGRPALRCAEAEQVEHGAG